MGNEWDFEVTIGTGTTSNIITDTYSNCWYQPISAITTTAAPQISTDTTVVTTGRITPWVYNDSGWRVRFEDYTARIPRDIANWRRISDIVAGELAEETGSADEEYIAPTEEELVEFLGLAVKGDAE